MSKKPDFSLVNIPALKKLCSENNLQFAWKKEDQGHAVISASDIELYVWTQRMAVQIRRLNGHELSKNVMRQEGSRLTSNHFLHEMVKESSFYREQIKKRALVPRFKKGVVVTRIPKDATEEQRRHARHLSRELSKRHSTNWV